VVLIAGGIDEIELRIFSIDSQDQKLHFRNASGSGNVVAVREGVEAAAVHKKRVAILRRDVASPQRL
jgi:hypothetical protein